jgi:class 3 adenylate cyclase
MGETRKLAAILCSDVVGYSRLAGADEDRTLARLRALRSDLIDPTIAVHRGRVVKRTGDGSIVEFRSVVDAVRCAIEVQNAMIERNAGVSEDRRIVFRIGIHVGDVVEESDGDLMGDGVNIAARLEGIAQPGAICLSEDAYRQVKKRLDVAVADLGEQRLKNITEPVRAYSVNLGGLVRDGGQEFIQRARLLVVSVVVVIAVISVAVVAWRIYATIDTTAISASTKSSTQLTRGNAKCDRIPAGSSLEPPMGSLPSMEARIVDDGTCPPDCIKQIIGGDSRKAIPRLRRCILRSAAQ